MKIIRLLILLHIFPIASVAQTGMTQLSVPSYGRFDDIYFINDSVGWLTGGYGIQDGLAKIYATRDGGETWKVQLSVKKYLRSIEFATEKIGFCGSLDSTLYKTTGGGQTWVDVAGTIPTRPRGICGLCIPDSSTVYGVGKYTGNACVIKSIDAGNTWSYIDMTPYAKGLVDVYFMNKNEGFVTGITHTEGGIILYTNDGGATWTTKFKTNVNGDYVWKIQTPDNVNFYASVESMPFTTNSRYLQSSDGGVTWRSVTWANTFIRIQGIGFLTPQIGWLGGDTQLYKTIDGGKTWQDAQFGPAFDRMSRISDKIAYFACKAVYKYNVLSTGNYGNTKPNDIHFLQVTPNPVKNTLKIQSVFQYPTFAMLSIYDNNGVFIAQPLNRNVKAGSLTVNYNFSAKAAGIYYVILKTNEGMIYKKIVKQ